MTWDEIFEWMNVDPDNEIWFDNIDDIKQVVEFVEQDGWKVDFNEKKLSFSTFDYLGLWFSNTYRQFMIGKRIIENVDKINGVIFYSDYPFAAPQVNIDVDQLSSLF